MEKSREQKLLPCPFCGKMPTIETKEDGKDFHGFVGCVNPWCKITPHEYFETKEEALEAWNKRAK